LDLAVVSLHLVQLSALKVAAELVVEAAAVPVLFSLVDIMLMAHQEAPLQSMLKRMVDMDMMILR